MPSHAHSPYYPKATTPQFLRYVIAIDDAGSFRAGAELAGVSQPTLSNAIQNWEHSMGVTLFERKSRGVIPTKMGRQIIEAARVSLSSIKALEGLAIHSEAPFHGALRIGMIPTVGPYLMPYLHAGLKLAYPDLELQLIEGTTQDLLKDLDTANLDLALMALLPGLEDQWTTAPIYEEEFYLATSPRHALSDHNEIELGDIELTELLLLEEGHCLRDQALEVCQLSISTEASQRYRATSLETLRQLVASGFGITLLPALSCLKPSKELHIAKLESSPTRKIAFLWRNTDPRDEAFYELIDAIRYSLPQDLVKLLE